MYLVPLLLFFLNAESNLRKTYLNLQAGEIPRRTLKVKIIFDIFLPCLLGDVQLSFQYPKGVLLCAVLCAFFGNEGLLLKFVG
jgi:hypothetical protein